MPKPFKISKLICFYDHDEAANCVLACWNAQKLC